MAQSKIEIIITALDRATKPLRGVADAFDRANSKSKTLTESLRAAAVPSAALAASLAFGVKSVLNASQELENALLGLARVSVAMGESQDEAKVAAQQLASDGLLSVKEAATGLKNLLATGFSLPQAIDLMNGFRDAAAFNRQGTLQFGQAIVSATIGLKNQNSILIDNVGITKNLSIMIKEAGLSQEDFMRITDDASVRQKILNEILEEAAIFNGDAAIMSETYSGKVAALNTQIFVLKATIGDKLKPVMIDILSRFSNLIEKAPQVFEFFEKNTNAAIIFAGAITGALVPAFVAAAGALAPLVPFVVAGGALATLFVWLDKLSTKITGFGLLEQLKAMVELLKPSVESLRLNLEWLRGELDKFSASKWNIPNQVSSLIQLLNPPGKQFGGAVKSGEPYVVGERGPEMFVPNEAGRIEPNIKTGGGGMTFNANVYVGMYAGSALEKRRIAEELIEEYRFLARARGRDTLSEIARG